MNDLKERRFGKLVVTETYRDNKRTYCKCQCDCGKTITTRADLLVSGKTRSCGCIRAGCHKGNGTRLNSRNADGTDVRKLEDALAGKLQRNNTTGHRGVNYDKSVGVYKAFIKFKGKQYYLGSSSDINTCIKLRKEAEQRIFTDFIEWYYKTNKTAEE